eukprot:c20161_g1_i1 orf=162-1940(-)
MLSRLSAPRRPRLSLHFLRHFSLELPVLSKDSQQVQGLVQEDACCDGTVKVSVRSRTKSRKVQHSDGAVKLFERSSTELHSDGDKLLSVSSQAGIKRAQIGDGDAKLSQNESREVHLRNACAKFSKQSQIVREEGHHSHGLEESIAKSAKTGKNVGKRTDLQTCRASRKFCSPSSESLEVFSRRKGPSEDFSSLASETGGDSMELIAGNVSNTERDEEDKEQNAVKQVLSLKKFAPSLTLETRKQVKVRKIESTGFAEVYSVVIKRKATDEFLQNLQQKINLMHAESALQSQVEALLKRRAFLSASPKKLAAVLKVLKDFFGSSDMACTILTVNAGVMERPLELLKQRLQVLIEFEVDKVTCHRLGTRPGMLTLKVERYKSGLAFFKELGLSAVSRNKLICRRPVILKQSESSMQSTLDFFESVGVTGPKLLNLLELHPEVFGSSVKNNLMVKHKLLAQLGFSAKEFVEALRFISKFSNEHVLSQYNFLRKQGISHEDVSKMIRRQPSILSKSVEDLEAKLHFLLHILCRDISEVLSFPAYLAYSLKGRIIPRFKALEGSCLSRMPRLSSILSVKNSDFKTRFKLPDAVKCT